jgi:hypothetical protein
MQIIQNPQMQGGQVLQLSSAGPQLIQAQPVLQTIQSRFHPLEIFLNAKQHSFSA